MKNSCIVLEGGGLRGAFTSGVMEYLLERDLNFDRVIGVSAGACVGASFLSKQVGRNRIVNLELLVKVLYFPKVRYLKSD